MSERRFPALRIVLYVIPPALIVVFFPFRLFQWIGIAALVLFIGSYLYSRLLFLGVRIEPVLYDGDRVGGRAAARDAIRGTDRRATAEAVMHGVGSRAAEQSTDRPVVYGHPGVPIRLRFSVRNESRLPAPGIAVDIHTPSDIPTERNHRRILDVRARDKGDTELSFTVTKRGEYTVSPVILGGGDPFGLFPWRITERESLVVVVYPRLLPSAWRPAFGMPGGAVRTGNRTYEDLNRVASIRDYLPGDDPRRIHWKASAKIGDLCTKEYVPALDAPALVLLDLFLDAFPDRYRYDFVERAITLTASLVRRFGGLGQRTAFVTNGMDGGSRPVLLPSKTARQTMLVLRVLARLEPAREDSDPFLLLLSSGVRVGAGGVCIVISPRRPEEYAYRLAHPTLRPLATTCYQIGGAPSRKAHPGITYRYVDDPEEELADAR